LVYLWHLISTSGRSTINSSHNCLVSFFSELITSQAVYGCLRFSERRTKYPIPISSPIISRLIHPFRFNYSSSSPSLLSTFIWKTRSEELKNLSAIEQHGKPNRSFSQFSVLPIPLLSQLSDSSTILWLCQLSPFSFCNFLFKSQHTSNFFNFFLFYWHFLCLRQ